MTERVLGRAMDDILSAERQLRRIAEGQNREFRDVLRDVAYRLAGEGLESERRTDPRAPDGWTPARWQEFFRAALQSSRGAWDSTEEVRQRIRRLEAELEGSGGQRIALEEQLERALAEVERLAAPTVIEDGPAKERASVLEWPVIPPRAPTRFAVDLGSGQRWRREAMVLYLLAVFGWSVRLEVLTAVGEAEGIGGRSGSLKRVFGGGLVPGGFVEEAVLAMNLSRGQTRLAAVRLTERGREVCLALGWEPVEPEWGRLVRLHQGDLQEAHTAAVLAFAFHARRRKWKASVVPDLEPGPAAPDVLVERDGDRAFVEVELGDDRHDKWRNLSQLQGFVALCAATEDRRANLVAECKLDALSGRATDLESLIRHSGGATNGQLWLEAW